MRRLLAVMIALVVAAPAWAGLHLRWDAPFGHPDAAIDKTFACDRNSGSERLVFSFWCPDSIERVSGFIVVADIQFQQTLTPDWWQNTCRSNGFFFEPTPDPSWDITATQLPVSGGLDLSMRGPNRMRLRGLGVLQEEGFGIGPATGKVFLTTVLVTHSRTVPAGTIPPCTGCAAPACIVFNQLLVESLTPDNSIVRHNFAGFAGLDQQFHATWQGGTTGVYPCPAAVSVRPSSWGRIKASYR